MQFWNCTLINKDTLADFIVSFISTPYKGVAVNVDLLMR